MVRIGRFLISFGVLQVGIAADLTMGGSCTAGPSSAGLLQKGSKEVQVRSYDCPECPECSSLPFMSPTSECPECHECPECPATPQCPATPCVPPEIKPNTGHFEETIGPISATDDTAPMRIDLKTYAQDLDSNCDSKVEIELSILESSEIDSVKDSIRMAINSAINQSTQSGSPLPVATFNVVHAGSVLKITLDMEQPVIDQVAPVQVLASVVARFRSHIDPGLLLAPEIYDISSDANFASSLTATYDDALFSSGEFYRAEAGAWGTATSAEAAAEEVIQKDLAANNVSAFVSEALSVVVNFSESVVGNIVENNDAAALEQLEQGTPVDPLANFTNKSKEELNRILLGMHTYVKFPSITNLLRSFAAKESRLLSLLRWISPRTASMLQLSTADPVELLTHWNLTQVQEIVGTSLGVPGWPEEARAVARAIGGVLAVRVSMRAPTQCLRLDVSFTGFDRLSKLIPV